jgi:hypothetical protein
VIGWIITSKPGLTEPAKASGLKIKGTWKEKNPIFYSPTTAYRSGQQKHCYPNNKYE